MRWHPYLDSLTQTQLNRLFRRLLLRDRVSVNELSVKAAVRTLIDLYCERCSRGRVPTPLPFRALHWRINQRAQIERYVDRRALNRLGTMLARVR